METPETPFLRLADGKLIPLGERMTLFGSAPDSGIVLHGEGIQPKHGYILYRAGAFHIRSLHAEFPVLVDGAICHGETEMRPGSLVRIGDQELHFSDPVSMGSNAPDLNLAYSAFEAMAAVLETRDYAETSKRLVQSVARLMRCDGVALVKDKSEGEIEVLASFPPAASPRRFSGSALEQARELNATLLLYPGEAGSNPSLSISENRIASLLCAPLLEQDQLLGFLYLDRVSGGSPFTEEDRQAFESLRRVFALILSRALRLEIQARVLRQMQEQGSARQGILGSSPAMRTALEQAQAVARTQTPVFIHGETGTGKELFAHYIHQQSPVAQGPFIAINCGAIAPNLIESELFGHEKGAFTGATDSRAGWIEQANGGTLFLDELGELDLSLQTRLLRVLQENEVVRVGGREPRHVDFRLVSASHRHLQEMVHQGKFREDLYYRVHVIAVELPALRDRGEDLLMLAQYFLQQQAAQQGIEGLSLGRKAERAILAHAWPGNVRELQNAIQRAVILCKTHTITPADLGLASRAEEVVVEEGAFPTLQESREEAERQCCEQALTRTRGNVSQAARLLDIDRKALTRILERLELDADRFK
ncbi:MAG TPA: sigma 54-interacting transcriptional regulator [Fibrobacteraceae bacterium]|nr:sigma 54-interacting transcriptional regulator [Fibrobacteraceae bacterium]